MEKQPHNSPKRAAKARARRLNAGRNGHASIDASLVQALEALPASRAGMVARARRLVNDPGYPYAETIWALSEILATHLEFDGFSY